MNEGLLIVCLGDATRCTEKMKDFSEEYRGTMKLGEMTESYDASEPISARRPWKHISGHARSHFMKRMRMGDGICVLWLTDEQIEWAAKKFVGRIRQRPPLFSSAVKQNGEPVPVHSKRRLEAKWYDVTDSHT